MQLFVVSFCVSAYLSTMKQVATTVTSLERDIQELQSLDAKPAPSSQTNQPGNQTSHYSQHTHRVIRQYDKQFAVVCVVWTDTASTSVSLQDAQSFASTL